MKPPSVLFHLKSENHEVLIKTMGDLIFTKRNHLATITLNRPDYANAFSDDMIKNWLLALGEIRDNDDIYAAVLTGSGNAFCAGGDVTAMAEGEGFFFSEEDLSSTALARKNSLWKRIQRIPLTLEQIDKPIVAKINGAAFGAGLDMALMCDIRIASTKAKLSESYLRVGILPGDGGTYFLPPLVRKDKALDMFWTCKAVTGAEAEKIGLVTYAVDPEELDAFTDAYMQKLIEMPQQAVRFTKRAVMSHPGMTLRASLDMVSSSMGILTELDDYKKLTARLSQGMKKKK